MLIPIRDRNPPPRFPFVSVLIMLVNGYLFFRQLLDGLDLSVWQNGVIPWEITHWSSIDVPGRLTPEATIISSMFHHGGFLHILGNMLYLWIFGANVENSLGAVRFSMFYLGAGIVGMLAHVLTNPLSTVPAVGASGAIAGVLGAYMLLFPRARIRTVIFLIFYIQIVDLPSIIVVGLWAFLQAVEGLSAGSEGLNVAVFAHLGGFVWGCFMVEKVMKR
jgi:membrane associated rhomboid family serine protease